jgi:hypothetical protein
VNLPHRGEGFRIDSGGGGEVYSPRCLTRFVAFLQSGLTADRLW